MHQTWAAAKCAKRVTLHARPLTSWPRCASHRSTTHEVGSATRTRPLTDPLQHEGRGRGGIHVRLAILMGQRTRCSSTSARRETRAGSFS